MSDFQDCTGGRAFEILVKQHPEMSLFVKHVADKQQFPVFLCRYGRHCHAYSLYGIFPRNPGQGISVAYLRKKKHSLGPRDPKRISRAE